ncbi:uncharacterized protein LOC128210548 [Mya arenaria]|uniref:uncharacterized protein LOC128210548 n=1 Tax=Mya arenaria TaxID=6604 RepID=UPI0022E0E363|nr:uncharacterized protein LOC128210548 [Mya arenaria]
MRKYIWSVAVLLLTGLRDVDGVSQRKIYTLHTEAKTWNAAAEICKDQLGHLVKVKGVRELQEILFMDTTEGEAWDGQLADIMYSSGFWTGLHQPLYPSDSKWQYHDCDHMSNETDFKNTPGPTAHCGAYVNPTFDLVASACSEARPFICQRFSGDCWYEPFPEQKGRDILISDKTSVGPGLTASQCAMECRDEIISSYKGECWGFYFTTINNECELIHRDLPDVSSTYVRSANRFDDSSDPDLILYIRRCFEGEVDTGSYNKFTASDTLPSATTCDVEQYYGESVSGEVCFCSTQDHPPIPPTTSSEEAAAQIEKELTLDSSNTSSAIRSKTSAEDNRPSAIGVGASLGAGMLAFVFGGLFLLDLPVLIETLKGAIQSFTSSENAMQTLTRSDSDC